MSCTMDTNQHDIKLREYFNDQWEQNLKHNPELATYLGDHRYNDQLTDMSIDAINERNMQLQKSYKKILAMNRWG